MAGVFPRLFVLSYWALRKCQALRWASLHVCNSWEHSCFLACLQFIPIQAFRMTALGPNTHLPLRDAQEPMVPRAVLPAFLVTLRTGVLTSSYCVRPHMPSRLSHHSSPSITSRRWLANLSVLTFVLNGPAI